MKFECPYCKRISEMTPNLINDRTGRKSGMLTAIAPTDGRSQSGEILWLYECECGNRIRRSPYRVENGLCYSCGCVRRKFKAESGNRTDPNKVEFKDDIATLITNGKYNVEFIIDAEDYDKIKEYRWYYGKKSGYIIAKARKDEMIRSSKSGRKYKPNIYLHRLLCPTDKPQVDHIDGNKRNNRKENLRPCSHTQNFGNQKKRKTYAGKPTKFQYKGVYREGKNKMWKARVDKNGECYKLGPFETELQAVLAYNKKAKELFGEFARLNEVKRG